MFQRCYGHKQPALGELGPYTFTDNSAWSASLAGAAGRAGPGYPGGAAGNPAQFVSKDTLIARVWPCSVVEQNNLRVHIAALRRALDGQRYILNDPNGTASRRRGRAPWPRLHRGTIWPCGSAR